MVGEQEVPQVQRQVLGEALEILDAPAPRVGLMSVGEEQIKGTDTTRRLFSVLEKQEEAE